MDFPAVILVKFKRSEFFGDEAVDHSPVKVFVSGTVANDYDFFILPLSYEEYNDTYLPSDPDLPTISEIAGGADLPHGANGIQ